jgi:hypothetical protein
VEASLEHDLGGALGYRLTDPTVDFLRGKKKGFGTVGVAVEGAKATAVAADIGIVDVPVYEEGDGSVPVDMKGLLPGGPSQVEEVGLAVQSDGLRNGETVCAGSRLLEKRVVMCN